MIKRLLFIIFLITVTIAVDYCQVQQSNSKMFLTSQELRTIQLKTLIKGYDLQFNVDDPDITLYSAYQVTNKAPLDLGQYNIINSFDIRSPQGAAGMGKAALLVQKQNNQDIALWMGKFQGDNSLPKIGELRQFKLPQNLKAKCFDFRLSNDKGDAGFLNCQTIPDNPQQQVTKDLFCFINVNDTQLSLQNNCIVYPTKYNALKRITTVLTIKDNIYFLSSNKALTDDLQSINYIEIYYLNDKAIELKAQIRGFQLQKPQFQIANILITNNNQIILADSLNYRLIYFRYQDETVVLGQEILLPSKPLDIFYLAKVNHLFLATELGITEHLADDPSQVFAKYEVDSGDSSIINVQVSDNLVIFTTNNGNLNIYQRNQYKINYLLAKQTIVPGTHYILSQYKNVIFTLSSKKMESVIIAPSFAEISNIKADKTIKIAAKSSKSQCTTDLNINFVKDSSMIIHKKPIQESLFRVHSSEDLKLNLDEYFAGANLQYKISQNTLNSKDFDISLSHTSTYDFTPSFETTQASSIINIDDKSFYFVGVNTIKQSFAYVDVCSVQEKMISCKPYYKSKVTILNRKQSISFIRGERTSSGEYYVGWGYKYSGVIQFLRIKEKASISYYDHGYPIQFNNILFANNYQLLISKGLRRVILQFNQSQYSLIIDEQFFTQQQLKEVQYFYAREVYIDRSSQNIFYVKLPTKVAKFILLDNLTVQYLGIVLDFGEFIMDKDWSLIFNENKVITQRNNKVDQWYYNDVSQKYIKLQSLKQDNVIIPLHYDVSSNLATIVTTEISSNGDEVKNIKIFKPFTSSIDTQYYQIKTKGDIQISNNWIFISSDNMYTATYVNNDPILSISSHMDDESFKADLIITISVKNDNSEESINTNVQAVNFPVKIKENPNDKVITLPQNTNRLEIIVPMQKYFNGSITDYKLQCPMCGETTIHLDNPISLNKTIQKIPAILDFVKMDNRVIAVANNILIIMNNNGEIITRSPIRIQNGLCTNLQYNSYFDLLIYCSSQNTQFILRYFVNNDKFIYADKYQLLGQSHVDNFDQMFAVTVGQKTFLFILDNDQSIDSNNKKSTLKVFDVSKDFFFMGVWDSTTFGTHQIHPINDFQVKDGLVLVTLGSFGIGYGNLNQKFILINPGHLRLSNIPQIKDITLEDSFFKQIEILLPLSPNQDVNVFITTTNSFSMVLGLARINNAYSFISVTERYFRYGALRLLNWQTITKNSIYLSYYNSANSQIHIVYYNRTVGVNKHFSDSTVVKISKNLLKYHEAILTDNNVLFTSQVNDDMSVGKLSVYNLYKDYMLILAYSEYIQMDHIDIIASNYYNQAKHIQKIKFNKPVPPTPEPEPLKWYIIVIIVACILIAIGIVYGIYLYRKKKRAEKNVSLLTQREEQNDSAGQQSVVRHQNPEPQQQGLNRTSINADEQ